DRTKTVESWYSDTGSPWLARKSAAQSAPAPSQADAIAHRPAVPVPARFLPVAHASTAWSASRAASTAQTTNRCLPTPHGDTANRSSQTIQQNTRHPQWPATPPPDNQSYSWQPAPLVWCFRQFPADRHQWQCPVSPRRTPPPPPNQSTTTNASADR